MDRLVIPRGTTGDLARIGKWVEACCAEFHISGQAAYHIQLAVDEACANIFIHGYQGRPGAVQLDVTCTVDTLTISIRDWGHSFDPNSVAFPNPIKSIEERPIGGLGIFLMHKVMDDVVYQFDTGNGNELRLVKNLK